MLIKTLNENRIEVMKNSPVLAIIGEKGGIGKSTTSNVLSQILNVMFNYENVLYVNFDKKQQYREKIVPEPIQFVSITDDIEDLQLNTIIEHYNINACVIDTGGFEDSRLIDNMKYIDTLIFPTMPDAGSYEMLGVMFNHYKEYIGKKQIIIVINNYDNSHRLTNFENIKQIIIENYIENNGFDVKDFQFVGIKNSKVPLSLNAINPKDKVTLKQILSKPNSSVYAPYLDGVFQIASLIEENINKVNQGE